MFLLLLEVREMNKDVNLSVTLDTKQFERAIEKANELVSTIEKAKTLGSDLAYMLSQLNFKPSVSEKPEDVQ